MKGNKMVGHYEEIFQTTQSTRLTGNYPLYVLMLSSGVEEVPLVMLFVYIHILSQYVWQE